MDDRQPDGENWPASRECRSSSGGTGCPLHTPLESDGGGCDNRGVDRTEARPRWEHLQAGARRLGAVVEARRLMAGGMTLADAAVAIEVPVATLWRWCARVRGNAAPTAEDLADMVARSGRRARRMLTSVEAEAIRERNLERTNRTRVAGSLPEAVRLAVRDGVLGEDLAEAVLERGSAGLPLLTRAQSRAARVGEVEVRALRSPRNAWLDYVSSPGSLQLTVDDETGRERFVQPGEWWTLDDGSINLCVVVEGVERPGDKCWERHGVVVGRFQLLLLADHRSYFIPGWSYTVRPRDSYRAEDLTATMQIGFTEHGAPRRMVLERGVSASRLMHETLGALGVEVEHVSSPHQKVVEFLFNKLWTKLARLPGQVGRFRGEEEEANRLLESVRSGARDPRPIFPTLGTVIEVLREVVAEHNSSLVRSARYGQWVPAEFWGREAHKNLRPVPASDAWMFSPRVTDPLKVDGMMVATSVGLLPGQSTRFVFGAPWMTEWHGRRVKLFFNPHAGKCVAKVVLAEDTPRARAGTVLGDAEQLDRLARFTRRALEYGLDPDIGKAAAAAGARSLRRHSRAMRTDGSVGAERVELRDAAGNMARLERGMPAEDGGQRTGDGGLRTEDGGRSRARPASRDGAGRWRDPRLEEFLVSDTEPDVVPG